MKSSKGQSSKGKSTKGFTIVELMVGVAIVGLLTMIAIPSMSEWLVKMRVDNEISTMHRLILTARNTAVNSELPVIICPLDGNSCVNDWTGEISVFIDVDNQGDFDAGVDTIIRMKDPISDGDNLTYDFSRLTYRPTGQATGISIFSYCPSGTTNYNRGIEVSRLGRAYATSDTDNDGKDEENDGSEISCS